jgi:hypothetical protein
MISSPYSRKEYKRLFYSVLAIMAFHAIYELGFDNTALVNPMPGWITLVATIIGALFGFFFILGAADSEQNRKTPVRYAIAMVGFPLFFGIFFNHPARLLYEELMFAGLRSDQRIVEAVVVGTDDGRKIRKLSASIQIGAEGPKISVPVTETAYSALEPYRAPGLQCFNLRVETGRHGVQRVIVPTQFFDEHLAKNDIINCSDR